MLRKYKRLKKGGKGGDEKGEEEKGEEGGKKGKEAIEYSWEIGERAANNLKKKVREEEVR